MQDCSPRVADDPVTWSRQPKNGEGKNQEKLEGRDLQPWSYFKPLDQIKPDALHLEFLVK